jgi:Spy/CpxP family protein refolding chaperone
MARLAVTATHWGLALLLCALGAAHADDNGQPAATAAAGSAPLDNRVQLMAKELDLDANQQARLKSILLAHRAEVTKAWNDPSVPAAVRIATTQAVSEKTAERIRAVLNDEQRAKYAKAHQRDARVGAPGGDVQKWMHADPG